MSELTLPAWPLMRLGEAVEVLARHAGFEPANAAAPTPATFSREREQFLDIHDIDRWLEWACAEFGIESEAVATPASELTRTLRTAGPALIRHVHDGHIYVVLLLNATAHHAKIVTPERRIATIALTELHRAMTSQSMGEALDDVELLLSDIASAARPNKRAALLNTLTASHDITGCWLLRAPARGSFFRQLSHSRLSKRFFAVIAISACAYGAEILAWTVMGKGALGGQLGFGWLIAWVLLLFTMVPLGLLGRWLQGIFAIEFGTLLKQRLLSGALRMRLDDVRQQGVGQLLGRVIESQAFDAVVLGGGIGVILALIELGIAAWVLSLGAGGLLHVVLLLCWLTVALLLCLRFFHRHRQWTRSRLELTHDLVENMAGHRTRLVQQTPDNRHAGEDRRLERFLTISRRFDRSFLPLAAGLSRGWLVIGLIGLAPAFVAANNATVGLAIGLGGVLLGYRGFGHMAAGMSALVQAAVAWQQIAPLFRAAAPTDGPSTPRRSDADSSDEEPPTVNTNVLVQGRNLTFRYHENSDPVLDGCDVTVYHGDRILLQGLSGGGKSTLVALLAGLRQPDSGLLLLNGLDRQSWGNTWRQISVAAPQFHENHILTGTLAFNLLMGKRWPPTQTDLAQAKSLCHELGLGDLLDRMPAGLLQMVGETGWQLSHGERSRVFLARALLQQADLVVLDESFAALDPETLTTCIQCAREHAATLMVIAHP